MKPRQGGWAEVLQLLQAGDLDQAVREFRNHPCSEEATFQKYVAWYCYNRKRYDLAEPWFTLAAKVPGDGEAYFGLGSTALARGDPTQALQHFEHASRSGFVRAYHWAAAHYLHGHGTTHNPARAAELYAEGASQGYLAAKRGLLEVSIRHGKFLQKLWALVNLVALVLAAFFIARKNARDERLIDVPNKFSQR